MNFDFDELSRLAKDDPEMFELTRQQLIHAEIAKAPEARQRELLELQRDLDSKRKRMDSAQFINHCMARVNENLENLENLEDQWRCIQALAAKQ